MADLEDDFSSRAADLTLSRANLSTSSLKEGAYHISRRVLRGGTYYLTRHGMAVEPSLLNDKSNAQIVSPSPFSCFFFFFFN